MKTTNKKVYLVDNSDASTVIVARPSYNKPILLWEKERKAEKKAFWEAKKILPEIGEAYPYHISRDCIAEYVRVCSEQGFDVSALESVSGEIPPDASPATTTAKITVKRTKVNPCGLTLCPTSVMGNSDLAWEYLKGMRNAVKGVVYDKKEKGYYVPSLFVMDALEYLSETENPSFDCGDIFPYAEIVNRWGKMYQYSFPENPNLVPYPYQERDAQQILDFRRGLLALEMGLGKSLTALMATRNIPGVKAIVCPASLRGTWENEISRAFPSATFRTVSNANFSLDTDYVIMSYETLVKHTPDMENGEISALVVDEGHNVKAVDCSGHPASTRAECFLRVAAFAEFVILLTGTPLVNSNADLWNFLKASFHPLTLGDGYSFLSFVQAFTEFEKSRFGIKITGYKNSDLLNKEMRKIMVRRTTISEFPQLKKFRFPISCEINTEFYEEKIAEYMRQRDTDNAAALRELNAARIYLAQEKAKFTVDYLKGISEGNAEKYVVFTDFLESAKILKTGLGEACVSITGLDSDAETQKAVDSFQNDEKTRFIVCSYKKAGCGFTLTASSTLFLNDFPWTMKDIVQAESRIARISQLSKPKIGYICANNIDFDTFLAGKLQAKSENACDVIDGGKGDKLDMKSYFSEL